MQTNHATFSVAIEYRLRCIPNIVLIGVPDVDALEVARMELLKAEIKHWAWTEPDFGLGFTSITTVPISGEKRLALAHYDTWKPILLSSPNCKAANSNLAHAGAGPAESPTGASGGILTGL